MNALLELDDEYRIEDVTFLPVEQVPPIHDWKLSIVDVKCHDHRGTEYVVEMQVFNTRSFEERIVYNASKSFVLQLPGTERYSELGRVIGVTICNFKLWPDPIDPDEPKIPMLSRWRLQEQHTGAKGLSQIQYAFLELPKYTPGPPPESMLEKWTRFFREAGSLEVIPPELDCEPFREAFEVARIMSFSETELIAYDREKMAEGDARGRVELAKDEGLEKGLEKGREEGLEKGLEKGREEGLEKGLEKGREEGRKEGLRSHVEDLCDLLDIELTAARSDALDRADVAALQALREKIKQERQWSDPWSPLNRAQSQR